MSRRLKVLISERELAQIRRMAEQENLAVEDWVRRTLRSACSSHRLRRPEEKLRAIRRAVKYSFPTTDLHRTLNDPR